MDLIAVFISADFYLWLAVGFLIVNTHVWRLFLVLCSWTDSLNPLKRRFQFVVFANFCGVNTSAIANFKLPTWHCWMGSWEEKCTIGSWKLAGAGSSPPLPLSVEILLNIIHSPFLRGGLPLLLLETWNFKLITQLFWNMQLVLNWNPKSIWELLLVTDSQKKCPFSFFLHSRPKMVSQLDLFAPRILFYSVSCSGYNPLGSWLDSASSFQFPILWRPETSSQPLKLKAFAFWSQCPWTAASSGSAFFFFNELAIFFLFFSSFFFRFLFFFLLPKAPHYIVVYFNCGSLELWHVVCCLSMAWWVVLGPRPESEPTKPWADAGGSTNLTTGPWGLSLALLTSLDSSWTPSLLHTFLSSCDLSSTLK